MTSWFNLVVVMLNFQRVSLHELLDTTRVAELLFLMTIWFTLVVVLLHFHRISFYEFPVTMGAAELLFIIDQLVHSDGAYAALSEGLCS